MINTIAHLADIHILENLNRQEEYKIQLNKTINKLKELNPDRIVIVGDLFHNFIQISNEEKIIASNFLRELSFISPVRITSGNHDLMKKNTNRVDSVEAIVKILDNPDIIYYNKTGFFEDENITFAVWHHIDKKSPWLSNHKKKSTQTYIDLYHDPIINCKTPSDKNGFQLFDEKNNQHSKLPKVSDFLGDFSFFGDIHLYQELDTLKKYSSSLIQQNYGETIENHGFVIWDIKNKKSKYYHIDNDWTYHNIDVKTPISYDDLTFIKVSNLSKHSHFKVKWLDYRSMMTTENENKIVRYLETTYSPVKIIFEKNTISSEIGSITENLSIESLESINIQDVFKEYMTINKYSNDIQNEVLNIDDEINDILQYQQSENVEWVIEKIWFDNFKSYGDGNIIDWGGVNGVVEISGLNQVGKTTILDAISYCLYGKTLSTITKEKNGDNRFINNKNTKNSCKVGCIIRINNVKYGVVRESIRSLNKKGEISGISTSLNYYSVDKLGNIDFKNLLTEEQTKDTQKVISTILGDFNDFIRLVLTNADNLNSLLSVNRSVFIDSILRDAGYDIFEKKLEVFKEWKINFNKKNPPISLDLKESDLTLKNLSNELLDINSKKSEVELKFKSIKEEINLFSKEKDKLNKSLNVIDEELLKINISDIENNIENINESITSLKEKEDSIKNIIISLPKTFDRSKLDKINIDIESLNNNVVSLKSQLNQYNNNINSFNNEIEKVNNDISNLKSKRVNELKSLINSHTQKINEFKNNISNYRLSLQKKSYQLISDNKEKLNSLLLEKKSILNNIDLKSKQIEDLKTSTKCLTCDRLLEKDQVEIIKNKINIIQSEIEKDRSSINDELINELINKDKSLNRKDSILKSDEWLDYFKENDIIVSNNNLILEEKNNIDKINYMILNPSTDLELCENIDIMNSEISNINLKINNENNLIENIKEKIQSIKDEYISKKSEKEKLESEKIEWEKFIELKSKLDNIPTQIENFELKIEIENNKIIKVKSIQKLIDENKDINMKIDEVNSNIENKEFELKKLNDSIISLEKDILITENSIKLINENIQKFKLRENIELIHNIYKECINREGVPMLLLRKSAHIINNEMSNLMMDLDFTIYFNDDMDLMMSMNNRKDICQNVIESSGKERTFAAIALKMALIQLNKKSKPNFILLDEIMGKLSENSITEFISLLDNLKTKINKIIIVEHVHPINYDARINVIKDKNGMSSLSMII